MRAANAFVAEVFDAQKAPGPRGAQIQPKSPCPLLLGLHAGYGDKAQRAGVGVQRVGGLKKALISSK